VHSSQNKKVTHSISPKGGLVLFGVAPSASFRDNRPRPPSTSSNSDDSRYPQRSDAPANTRSGNSRRLETARSDGKGGGEGLGGDIGEEVGGVEGRSVVVG
jgi:hypothetical protein